MSADAITELQHRVVKRPEVVSLAAPCRPSLNHLAAAILPQPITVGNALTAVPHQREVAR